MPFIRWAHHPAFARARPDRTFFFFFINTLIKFVNISGYTMTRINDTNYLPKYYLKDTKITLKNIY